MSILSGFQIFDDMYLCNPFGTTTAFSFAGVSTKRKRSQWSDADVRVLLAAVEDTGVERPTSIAGRGATKWKTVADRVAMVTGKEVDKDGCKNKWNMLKKQYKDFLHSQRQTGAERREFKFQEEISRILCDDHTTTPISLLSQSGTVTHRESKFLCPNHNLLHKKIPKISIGFECFA